MSKSDHRSGIAICAIFRNEAPFIQEWVAYHSIIGVDHFVLYDNGSDDGGGLNLGSLQGKVSIVPWPMNPPAQNQAYEHFIREFGALFEWGAFIDLDEFITPLGMETLPELMTRYNGYSLVLINWLNFGPWGSGSIQEVRPNGLVIERYDRCMPFDHPVNKHVKSIARMSDAVSCRRNVHVIDTSGPACNALGQPVLDDAIQPAACHDVLYLSHFYTRSRQDFEAKVKKGRADGVAINRQLEWFDHYVTAATIENKALSRFGCRVKLLLQRTEMEGGAAGSWIRHIINGTTRSRVARVWTHNLIQ